MCMQYPPRHPPDQKGPPLDTLSICQGLLLATIHHPDYVIAKYSIETLEMAAGHLMFGGQMALIAMLRQQGAAPALIRIRIAEFLAKTHYLAFAACSTFCIFADKTVKEAKSMPATAILNETRRILAETNAKSMMDRAWNSIIVYAARPEAGTTDVPNCAADAAGMMIRMETMLFTTMEPVLAVLYETKV